MPLAAASTGIMRAISMLTKSTTLRATAGSGFRPFPRRAAGSQRRCCKDASSWSAAKGDWHLPSGRGLRPQERPLDESRPHADAASRTGRRGPRRAHLRHFWRPDPRRLLLVGERDFHTVSLNGGNRRNCVERVGSSGSFSMVTEGGPTPEKAPTSALRICASLRCSKHVAR